MNVEEKSLEQLRSIYKSLRDMTREVNLTLMEIRSGKEDASLKALRTSFMEKDVE